MKLDNFVASSDIYDVYESDGMAVRIYKKPEYKEKCLYAALTHARVETTLGNSFIKMPVLHEVSVIDGKWAITMDFIKGKTLQQLMDENPHILTSLSTFSARYTLSICHFFQSLKIRWQDRSRLLVRSTR